MRRRKLRQLNREILVIELPSGFWSGWIIVLTVGSFCVLALLVYSVYFRDGPEHEDVVWDGNLREGDAPAPLWWFWLILVSMVFSVIYLLLYPGLGSFAGALRWSQAHQLAHSTAAYQKEFAQQNDNLMALPLDELARDARAMKAAKSIFATNCSTCHGALGVGQANRFPNLADTDWQWGGSFDAVRHSIAEGRNGVMPPWGSVLDDRQIHAIADYLAALTTAAAEPADDAVGKQSYLKNCAVCHQADATGNPQLGAPDLTDAIWLYGGSRETIMASIRDGRSGVMPAQKHRLTPLQIRLVTAWLVNRKINP